MEDERKEETLQDGKITCSIKKYLKSTFENIFKKSIIIIFCPQMRVSHSNSLVIIKSQLEHTFKSTISYVFQKYRR